MFYAENGINDLNVYLRRMEKSLYDKMFFIDKIFTPVDTVLDFGCANGGLIKCLSILFGDSNYAGFDISPEMIDAARGNVPEANFYSEWDKINIPFDRSLLNISSTVHEVYSYGTPDDISVFLERVFDSGFRYITIRDMMFSRADEKRIAAEDEEKLREEKNYAFMLEEYEKVWGKITSTRDMTHYLLKYRYTQNMQREIRENYLPLYFEDFMKLIPDSYEITYLDRFVLPYIRHIVKEDFGITLTQPTHIKLILEKKD